MAMPICRVVLNSPEASRASSCPAPDIPSVVSAGHGRQPRRETTARRCAAVVAGR
jgi:hypothetical protein